MSNQTLAAIDLGTNSCRLNLADSQGRIFYRDSIATKLGEGLYTSMCLTPEAIERGVQALQTYAAIMQNNNVKKYRAIATAACRMAKNSMEFVALVKEKTGISLEIIDGMEEARLNVRGALLNAPQEASFAVVYDLGGGSTEITLAEIQNKRILYSISIPWGGRNAAEAFDLMEFDPLKYQKLEQEIGAYVDTFVLDSKFEKYHAKACLIATSSTPLRLVSMVNDWGIYERTRGDGASISTQAANKMIDQIFAMNDSERALSPYIGENRAPIFVSACAIFKIIYIRLGFDALIASLKSAQNGIIEELRTNGKTNKIS